MSRLGAKLKLNGPKILFFVSSFCSKCMANRRKLEEYFDLSAINEINIAGGNELIEEVHPSRVPTLILIDKEGRIIFFREGLISSEDSERLAIIWQSLS